MLFRLAHELPDLELGPALTRHPRYSRSRVTEPVNLTNSIDELIDDSELVVECSGDVAYATEVIHRVLQAGKPVVTMNAEFHVTCGSYFVDRGYLTEAEGDQPGCLASLRREAQSMGFTPLVYGNMKGFLNLDPTPEEMEYWAARNGLRVHQTASFTDGTKLQIEQAFVANAFGADIVQQGLLGVTRDSFEDAAMALAEAAEDFGSPISDFVMSPGQPAGVFVVGTHGHEHRAALRYLKLGEGPYYTLLRPYHLCAFEIPKTIRSVTAGEPPLINNSSAPRIGVAAVAKRDLEAGTQIEQAVGGYLVRGEAVRMIDLPNHVPIGVLQGARLTRRVERGQVISVDDVELPESMARDIALELVRRATESAR